MSRIILGIFILFPFVVSAQTWTATKRNIDHGNRLVKVSLVDFKKENRTLTYAPSKMPLGLVLLEKIEFKNRPPYFITGWAEGARSILYRVFDPENHGGNPICERVSAGEQTQLQIVNNNLEIKIYLDNGKDEPIWTLCKALATTDRKLDEKK